MLELTTADKGDDLDPVAILEFPIRMLLTGSQLFVDFDRHRT